MVALAVLLFLTEPLSHLPNAVLAAIVFLIGVKLIDIRGLAKINKESHAEFSLALFTAATVVFIGVKEGIILAVVLSLLAHVRRGCFCRLQRLRSRPKSEPRGHRPR